VFQDYGKYQLSAYDNIAMGRHERYDEAEAVKLAAEGANADELIARLPDGYATRLGRQFAGGSDLSLGQWQRVALARAFFRDADFVILDEPTAALDARVEHDLFNTVRELTHDKTVLIIPHRFSTVRAADRIYVLDDGQIVEHGSHETLMEQGGLYAELFTLQASSYVDDAERPIAETTDEPGFRAPA
jgi:ATP-binding cassette subfamily B protein